MFRNNNLTEVLELIPGTTEYKDKRLRELEEELERLETRMERLERSNISSVIPECPVSEWSSK